MNALVRKEIRLILPFWGIAMLLALVPIWIFSRDSFVSGINPVVFWTFGFGVMLLGLAPFGQEFSLGTFSSLLAQPMERRRLWNIKMLLMSIAALLVFAALVISVDVRLNSIIREAAQLQSTDDMDARITAVATKNWDAWDFWTDGLMMTLAAIGGGLWTTLLFRQVGAALWFTILVPGVILVIVEGVFPGLSAGAQEITLGVALSVYSAIGFFGARRMFLHAQDSQWLGETISLFSLTPSRAKTESTLARRKNPLRALLRKEFQSHQISLLIAFGLLMFHCCTLVIRKYHAFPTNSEMRFALEAVPFLWLLVPWLIGSVAVAEERKLGVFESQLCLPVTRRLQFAVKLSVVLLLGIFLGGIIPWMVEYIGVLAHVSSDLIIPDSLSSDPTTYRAFALMSLAAAGTTTASFFASTLTRNTLQALGGALAIGIAFIGLFQWVVYESNHYDYSLWKGPLVLIMGVPVALIVVGWLSFSNYKLLYIGRSVWLRNVLIISGSLIITGILAAFIYQRPWELLMTLEPQHGPARLSGPIRPTICLSGDRVLALLPDGRLWAATNYYWKEVDRYEEVWDSKWQTNRLQKERLPIPTGGTFIDGSNWVVLTGDTGAGVAALRSDGTLWSLLSWRDKTNSWSRRFWFSLAPEPRRIGYDNDWKSVAVNNGFFLALKTDGSLWGWGNNEDVQFASDSPKYVAQPVRIGTNSDWAEIFPQRHNTLLMKNDGSIWEWSNVHGDSHAELSPAPLNGSDWLAVGGEGRLNLVIRRDGTLWVAGFATRLFGTHTTADTFRQFARVGNDSDWAQIAGEYSFLAAIKKDGRLLRNGTETFSSTLGQPSKYSDWLAADDSWDGLVAIAADGTISLWNDTRDLGWKQMLLAPSHRPFWSLNILEQAR